MQANKVHIDLYTYMYKKKIHIEEEKKGEKSG